MTSQLPKCAEDAAHRTIRYLDSKASLLSGIAARMRYPVESSNILQLLLSSYRFFEEKSS
jgi:hypothetical protein